VSLTPRILIVEDDPDSAEFLRLLLEPHGYAIETAQSGQEARKKLGAWEPELVLMDLMLPDVRGLDLLRDFRTARPDTQVIVVSGLGSIAIAVEAMEGGALSFIEKPINASVVIAMLHKASERLALAAENRRLKAELEEHTTFGNIVARSKPMRELCRLIRSVAPTDANVLVTGENGTGKELVATAIHQHSKRLDGPFIKVNCAAIPTELIESELFGHQRGAFTGAIADKQGLMEMADNGTLLLDEIGEVPPNVQVKLLRVLQDREFRPVGSARVVKPNFRLICSTNVNLETALATGKLREDLYFRINTLMLPVPPLRQRSADIPLLVEAFLRRFVTQHEREITGIDPEAAKALEDYSWPGNVRELEHVIERAVILAQGSQVMASDFPAAVRAGQARADAAPTPQPQNP